MTVVFNIILMILKTISLIIWIIVGIFSLYGEIMGIPAAEKLLIKLHIPLNYDQTILIGLICLAILIINYVSKSKQLKCEKVMVDRKNEKKK